MTYLSSFASLLNLVYDEFFGICTNYPYISFDSVTGYIDVYVVMFKREILNNTMLDCRLDEISVPNDVRHFD